MLHQDIKLPERLELRNQAKLHLFWKESIKRTACLNIPRYFNVRYFYSKDDNKIQAHSHDLWGSL